MLQAKNEICRSKHQYMPTGCPKDNGGRGAWLHGILSLINELGSPRLVVIVRTQGVSRLLVIISIQGVPR